MKEENKIVAPVTPKQYEKAIEGKDHVLPYLNAVSKFTPDPGMERTDEDDKAMIFDATRTPLDYAVTERIHLPRKQFDNIFVQTMNYIRGTEHLKYEAVQRGDDTPQSLFDVITDYLRRIHPEIIPGSVDERKLIERLHTAILGYYVLQPCIDVPETSDIKVCGPNDIRVRIKGKAYSSNVGFIDSQDLYQFVYGIGLRNHVWFSGGAMGFSPVITFADQHEKDYILRFVLSAPQITMPGLPYIHIRKVPRTKPGFDRLINKDHMLTVPVRDYLINRMKTSKAIVIAGPPGSGKTTMLNELIEFIPKTRETLVIQENDELFTKQPGFMFKHVMHGFDGLPAYSLEDLGRMALVEGCNEFVVGEVKGGEMRNVMTLINSGGNAAFTVHSTNAYQILDKLSDLVKYGSDYSFEEAHRMLSVVDTLVYMEGYKVREILEVNGYNDKTHSYNYIPMYKYNLEDI